MYDFEIICIKYLAKYLAPKLLSDWQLSSLEVIFSIYAFNGPQSLIHSLKSPKFWKPSFFIIYMAANTCENS